MHVKLLLLLLDFFCVRNTRGRNSFLSCIPRLS